MLWEEFLPDVLPFVASCPDETAIRLGVLPAAREFCQRTLVWQYTAGASVVAPASKGVYQLSLPATQELILAFSVDVGGKEYTFRRGASARKAVRMGSTGSATLNGVVVSGAPQMVLQPVPVNTALPLNVEIAVQPSMSATDWPDIISQYATVIANGAIARLASMPKTTWSDQQTAANYRAMFNDRVGTIGASASLDSVTRGERPEIQWV